MKPYVKNGCAGYYRDWLEVFLTSDCNGSCSFCCERNGYKPSPTTVDRMIAAINAAPQHNILLLGGEPTLYKDLGQLLFGIKKNVYMTTNGSNLSVTDVKNKNLHRLAGLNISIHSYDLHSNRMITGIELSEERLRANIHYLNKVGVPVRFNCNLLKGYVDTIEDVRMYLHFAALMGANYIKFSEVSGSNQFVNADNLFGTTGDPFSVGCSHDLSIGFPTKMHVELRRMCGLMTKYRPKPSNPEGVVKQILYCDGKIYQGWQAQEGSMDINKLLEELLDGKISKKDTVAYIEKYFAFRNPCDPRQNAKCGSTGCG